MLIFTIAGNQVVVGMAMATPASGGWGSGIHPLYADSPDIAKMMFKYLFENQPDVSKGVFLETIEPNAQNVKEFVSVLGIDNPTHTLRRMYTGKDITTNFIKIYSLSNSDLHLF